MLRSGSIDEAEVQLNSEQFIVSTEWLYLYSLGKLLIKRGLDLKYGLVVLDDCVEVMKLVGASESMVYNKAKYWIARGLFLSNYKEYTFI